MTGTQCTSFPSQLCFCADEALTKGRVCAFKPTVMYILYNAAM